MKNIEIWKAYPEFDFVEVSTLGNVRTLDRVVPNGRGTRLVKGHVLKQYRGMGGYLFVSFKVNRIVVNRKVHRLVAQTFIPNPGNLPEVNHKDCNRTNNNIDNLEWCSHSYNQKYREKYGVSFRHPLFAVNLNTMKVSGFSSQSEAGRELKISQGNIGMVVRCERKTVKGYWFTNADNNAVEATRAKFGDVVADKVKKLMDNR